jgi:haloalkane dehalogenase
MHLVRSIPGETRPEWLTHELFPFESRFVEVDGARVHYVDEGRGPVLLFLPGAPNWSFFYRRFVERLRDDFRCVAVDYPGFGLSSIDPRQKPTVPGLSRFVERFIEALALKDIILVAGDAGGPIGLGVAARHPDWFAGLVLAGTFGWPLREYPKVQRTLRLSGSPVARLLQERFNLLLRYTARTFPMSAAERTVYLAPYAGRAARRNPVLLLADLAGNDAFMRDIEQALQTRVNHLPVLLMWGDQDPVYEFLPRFQRIFPDARTLTIPGAHHFPFAEAPDQMIAEIRHWWKAVAAASESKRRVS